MSVSALGKKWVIKNQDKNLPLFEKLLKNRNLNKKIEIENFLNPSLERDLHDPFLMKDMKKAVKRIKMAVKNRERIIIFGDYDVDGISATAILVHALRTLNANVSYRLPHRSEDGYGLREKFVNELAKLNVKLIITVDNGISCAKEIDLANKKGIDVIVTDHHAVPETLPHAYAILHPKLHGSLYPFAELTGAGVAFKLAQALINNQALDFLDLACLGVVADLGPLRDENRVIAKFGLQMLAQTRWPGLSRLKHYAKIKDEINTRTISHILGPRLNAASRISHPYFALQLLLNEGEKSDKFASHLEKLNQKRQLLTSEMVSSAFLKIETQIQQSKKILILYDKSWHTGILGLIAGKLVEKYGLPAIAMEDRGKILVGSARSPEYFNIISAISKNSGLLIAFGGHSQAAGFELRKENLEIFIEKLNSEADEKLNGKDLTPQLILDCEIQPEDLNWNTLEMIEKLEPFGIGNEKPKFMMRRIIPANLALVGKENKHLKFFGKSGNNSYHCIAFNLGMYAKFLRKNSPVDIACELKKNIWNGNENLEMKILDFRY